MQPKAEASAQVDAHVLNTDHGPRLNLGPAEVFHVEPTRVSVHLEGDLNVSLPGAKLLERWLSTVAKGHNCQLRHIAYIIIGDEELHAMNVQYLNHDTLTDIITFDLTDGGEQDDFPVLVQERSDPTTIEGECYISLDRVRENAESFGQTEQTELLRVMAHGLLHLCGLDDKTEASAQMMRQAEDEALTLFAGLRTQDKP